MSNRVSQVNDELQDARRELARLRQEAVRHKEDREHTEADLRRRLNRAYDSQNTQVSLLQADLALAREERDEGRRLLVEQEKEVVRKLAEKEGELEKMKAQVLAAKQERNDLRKTVERIRSERETLRRQLATKDPDLLRKSKVVPLYEQGVTADATSTGTNALFNSLSLNEISYFSSLTIAKRRVDHSRNSRHDVRSGCKSSRLFQYAAAIHHNF